VSQVHTYPGIVKGSPLRVPEVARLLGLDGAAVYLLIADGELAAGRGDDGLVYVRPDAIEDYRRRHTAATS
jgi:hypothetical protein